MFEVADRERELLNIFESLACHLATGDVYSASRVVADARDELAKRIGTDSDGLSMPTPEEKWADRMIVAYVRGQYPQC